MAVVLDFSADRRRSLQQQIRVAQHYLGLAQSLGANEMRIKHGDVHDAWMHDASPPGYVADVRVLASAHMCSAAVRLFAVEDTLERHAHPASRYSRKPVNAAIERFLTGSGCLDDLSRWMHAILRDDIAHHETPPDANAKTERDQEWQQRLKAIKAVELAWTHAALSEKLHALDEQVARLVTGETV